MAAVCQDSTNTGSNLFGGPKGLQGPASSNYYAHCGYEAPSEGPHQYSHEGYAQYQMPSLHHHQHQQAPQSLHPIHAHAHQPPAPHAHALGYPHHQSPHPQQTPWGSPYGMGVMGSARSPHSLPISDEWAHGYLMAGNNASPQTPYGYQYRPPTNSHPSPLDYGTTPPHPGDSSGDHHGQEDSMSPQTPSPRGSSPGTGMGPNSQGAKSLRAPYEWMKTSASLPGSTGHSAVIAGKTRTKDKYRVVYSDHQRLELEKEFHFSKYITIRRKAEIAQQLGLSERQVKIWFQNRRAKERKQNKKREEQAMNQPSQSQNETNNKDNHNIQQQNYISSSSMQHLQQNDHVTSASYLIPKLEVEDEITKVNGVDHHADLSNMTHMGYHSSQNSSIPTSEQLLLSMNGGGTNPSAAMSTGTGVTGSISLMDRYHGPPNSISRFHHEGYPLPPHGMSPSNQMADDMMTPTIKMTSSDSSSNSINLSGSSDSGVLSSQ